VTVHAPQSFVFVAEDADVCGVDEAGRGPLAGPVVAAAVVLDRTRPIEGLRDSKLLTELQRVRLAGEIRRKAKAFAVGFATHHEIDGINILQASLLAMERAVLRLGLVPELVRVDGRQIPAFHDHARLYRAEPPKALKKPFRFGIKMKC
jgi:ribonuclease HII